MIKKKVSFRKFQIDTDKVLDGLRDYNSPFWPLDWTIVSSTMDFYQAKQWLKDNTKEKYNIHHNFNGCVIVFQSKHDSVKFQLFN